MEVANLNSYLTRFRTLVRAYLTTTGNTKRPELCLVLKPLSCNAGNFVSFTCLQFHHVLNSSHYTGSLQPTNSTVWRRLASCLSLTLTNWLNLYAPALTRSTQKRVNFHLTAEKGEKFPTSRCHLPHFSFSFFSASTPILESSLNRIHFGSVV
jgi:hypothetical protein